MHLQTGPQIHIPQAFTFHFKPGICRSFYTVDFFFDNSFIYTLETKQERPRHRVSDWLTDYANVLPITLIYSCTYAKYYTIKHRTCCKHTKSPSRFKNNTYHPPDRHSWGSLVWLWPSLESVPHDSLCLVLLCILPLLELDLECISKVATSRVAAMSAQNSDVLTPNRPRMYHPPDDLHSVYPRGFWHWHTDWEKIQDGNILGTHRVVWHQCCCNIGWQCGTTQGCWSKCRLWTGSTLVGHPVDQMLTCRLWGLQWLDGTVMEKHCRLEGCCRAPGDGRVTSLIDQTETDCLSSHMNSSDNHPVVLL